MTVRESLAALVENDYQIHEVPSVLLTEPVGLLVRWLMSSQSEDYQERANQEWVELIAKENDSLEAAKLVIDWTNDKTQAAIHRAGVEEVLSDPYQSLTE